MKLVVMWGLALSWFVVLAYLAVDALTQEAPILSSGRFKSALETLAGIGALTVGLVPVLAAATVHHVYRRRLRHRLEKQKAKIERRLARLDERRNGRPRPALAEGAPASEAIQAAQAPPPAEPPDEPPAEPPYPAAIRLRAEPPQG